MSQAHYEYKNNLEILSSVENTSTTCLEGKYFQKSIQIITFDALPPHNSNGLLKYKTS